LSAPGGVTAERSNCSTMHTPLWVSSIRIRPEQCPDVVYFIFINIRLQAVRNATTVTPLQHRCGGEMPETVCNGCVPISQLLTHTHTPRTPGPSSTCGLYYKLHGSARPINMKSNIIHKHSRHDACALTTHHPFSTSLESILPIWSSSVQSPRLQPDARVSSFCMTSLIPVLLSCSPLCTFLHLILLAFPTLMVPRPCPTLRSCVISSC
jgi:hypothetical protein